MDSIAEFLKAELFDRAFAVLGNPTTSQICLLDVDRELPLSESAAAMMRQLGLGFVGIMGYRARDTHAGVRTAPESGLPGVALMAQAVPAFLARIAESAKSSNPEIRSEEKSSGAEITPEDWLEKLYNLPDTRTQES